MSPLRKQLIENGVRNLREFGYPGCTADNIVTDSLYRAFFINMLGESRGKNPRVDQEIDKLLKEIEDAKSNA